MKEHIHLPLTKREAKLLFAEMLKFEETDKFVPKLVWQRHERIITKLQQLIYDSKALDPKKKAKVSGK